MTRAIRQWAVCGLLAGSLSCLTGSAEPEAASAGLGGFWVGSYAESSLLHADLDAPPGQPVHHNRAIKAMRLYPCWLEIDLWNGSWLKGTYEIVSTKWPSEHTMTGQLVFHAREHGQSVVSETFTGQIELRPAPGATGNAAWTRREMLLAITLPGTTDTQYRFVREIAPSLDFETIGCEDASLADAAAPIPEWELAYEAPMDPYACPDCQNL